ncbi:MAG: hypothetical protein KGO81_06950 [Bacteroidota bacterium]|nr:hypothetical protein [Bacteroidota bacterium]
MKLHFILPAVLLICLAACKGNNGNNVRANTDTASFLPVNDFIIADVKDIEHTPYFIYKIIQMPDGQKDSSAIDAASVEKIANRFLQNNFTDPDQKQYYTSSSFHDLSTKSYSFTYSSQSDKTPNKEILVLLDDETNSPKNIFIKRITEEADSTITEQLNWRIHKSLQVSRSAVSKTGIERNETIFVNWNDHH